MTRAEILEAARSILFSTLMVQAIMDDRKSVTRRVVKAPYYIDNADVCKKSGTAVHIGTNGTHGIPYPDSPYRPGDLLWVRETWCALPVTPGGHLRGHDVYYYKADGELRPTAWRSGWRSSRYMPKKGARLFLRVTGVRVERLQDITPYDAHDEGIDFRPFNGDYPHFHEWLIKDFRDLWDSLRSKKDLPLYGWEANPWVWVIEFDRVTPT